MAVVDAVHLGGMAAEAARGCFITFEGPEGAGKTTQIRRLQERIENEGFAVVVTREPGATTLGQALRRLMLDSDQEPLAPAAMALLMSADRAQHVSTVIRPALSMGAVVISDRYADSTYAYQGYGEGLDLGELRQITHLATGGLEPDLTVLLDLEPALGIARKRHAQRTGRAELNSMDERSIEFHRRVRAGFKALAQEDPNRFVVLDATGPADLLAMRIWKDVGLMIGVR
jgi:dTMP kinase